MAGSLDSPQSSLWSLRCRKDGGGQQPSRGTVGSGVVGHVVKSSEVLCQTPEGEAMDGVLVLRIDGNQIDLILAEVGVDEAFRIKLVTFRDCP